jgi:hypothetical protein
MIQAAARLVVISLRTVSPKSAKLEEKLLSNISKFYNLNSNMINIRETSFIIKSNIGVILQ